MVKSNINILLLAGSEDLNLKVLYCLFPAYENVYVVANKADNILKYSRYEKTFSHIPWSSHGQESESGARQLKQYCKVNEIALIIPGDIAASAFLYEYQNIFLDQKIFPVMADDILERIDNKWKFAEKLMAEKLPTPITMLIDRMENIDKENRALIEEKIGFPLIVKPLFCESSHGVEKIDNFATLREHVSSDKPYSSLPLIIQEFVDGYDIDLSFIADQGKILSMAVQKWNEGDVLEFCHHEEIENLGKKITKLYNYCGAGHMDMRISYTTRKLYILECNPRFWYTITAAMWQGLNFLESAVHYMKGQEYNKNGAIGDYRLPGAMIRMIIRNPLCYFKLSKNQRRGMWQPLLDPLPHIMKFLKNR